MLSFCRECNVWLATNHLMLPVIFPQISTDTHLELGQLWLSLQSAAIDPIPSEITAGTRIRTHDLTGFRVWSANQSARTATVLTLFDRQPYSALGTPQPRGALRMVECDITNSSKKNHSIAKYTIEWSPSQRSMVRTI